MKKMFVLILLAFLLIGCNAIQDEVENNTIDLESDIDQVHLTNQFVKIIEKTGLYVEKSIDSERIIEGDYGMIFPIIEIDSEWVKAIYQNESFWVQKSSCVVGEINQASEKAITILEIAEDMNYTKVGENNKNTMRNGGFYTECYVEDVIYFYLNNELYYVEKKDNLKLENTQFESIPSEKIIEIDSLQLKTYIKDTLGIKDDEITYGELDTITEIELKEQETLSLSGIQYLSNLESLTVIDTMIEDASYLHSNTSMRTIILSNNNLIDFNFLLPLKKLDKLLSIDNPLNKFEFEALTNNLTKLMLRGNKINDYSGLSKLTGLEELYIMDSEVSDTSFLSDMVNLRVLTIENSHLQNLDYFDNLVNIKSLNLSDNSIEDISILSKLVMLKQVELANNNIRNIDALVYSNDIIYDVSNNPLENYYKDNAIGEIDPTIEMVLSANSGLMIPLQIYDVLKIKNLDLTAYHLESLNGLEYFSNLEYLYLTECDLRDISRISSLHNLKYLYLNGNKLESINSLEGLRDLEVLKLGDNNISDIDILENMSELRLLSLSNNSIESIEALRNMQNLDFLDIRGNNVISVEPISNHENLKTLYLDYEKIIDLYTIDKIIENLESTNPRE